MRTWLGLAWISIGVVLAACPGRLLDPERFEQDGGGTTPPPACPTGYDVPTDLFQATCGTAGCHSGSAPASGLDLVSSGVATRLINKPSNECAGMILVTSPDAGFLFDKLGGHPACGFPMPLNQAPLTSTEMGCLQAWMAQQFDGGTGG